VIDGSKPILVVNEYAYDVLPDELQNIMMNDNDSNGKISLHMPSGDVVLANQLTESDILIFAPHNYNLATEDIEGVLGMLDMYDYTWTISEYDSRTKISCVTDDEFSLFSKATNPIVIYCSDNVRLSGSTFGTYRGIIYGITNDELACLDEELGISSQGYHLSVSNVGEVYYYQTNLTRKIISFLSSLCVLVLILDIAVMVSISNMEYRNSGIEYAIKKVVGYSFVQRHKLCFIKMNIGNVITLIVVTIIALITGLCMMSTCIYVGIVIIVIENILSILYTLRYEKESITKILKGGCL
jgi:hypothetical protein